MISFNNITVRFGGIALFESITFKINPKDRIGLVGRNGAGKTTMLKIMAGLQEYDEGQLAVPGGMTLGYLPQHMKISDKQTVMEEAMSAFDQINRIEQEIEILNKSIAERTDYESQEYMELITKVAERNERYQLLGGDKREGMAEQTLQGLGFKPSDFSRPTNEFSGGWRMRIELVKILLQKPDLLLLDEPTNHLDIESIEWLEDFLKSYHGSVVLVSHDRAFLDAITNRTIEISLGSIYDYPVPYTKYTELLSERIETQKAAFENQQKKIKKTEEFIEKFRYKATKAVQVQSRIKMLERMDRIEIDVVDKAAMNIKFPPAPRSGNIVLTAGGVSKRYGSSLVFGETDFIVEKGEKIGFVGRNGEGKSTMAKIIMQEIDHDGEMKIGHNVKIGYYAQNQPEKLNPNKTVFETIDDIAVGDIRTKTRDILGSFLFGGEDIDKPVSVLSGGEKSRLSLACMLLEPINLLVMDEPTHHLDIISKDILKQALNKYDGTLILISHDRDFLEGLTTKTLEFRDKKVKEHLGGIDEFIRKRRLERLNELNSGIKSTQQKEKSERNTDQKKLFEERKKLDREIRKIQRLAHEQEEIISDLEKKIEGLSTQLSNPQGIDINEVSKELDKSNQRMESAMEKWEKFHTQEEELSQQREKLQ